MKSKRAFTLIELLAVIVILAIIALIATPVILNVISSSKESVEKSSVRIYLNSIQKIVSQKNIMEGFSPSSCTLENGTLTCDGQQITEVDSGSNTNGEIGFEDGKIKYYYLNMNGTYHLNGYMSAECFSLSDNGEITGYNCDDKDIMIPPIYSLNVVYGEFDMDFCLSNVPDPTQCDTYYDIYTNNEIDNEYYYDIREFLVSKTYEQGDDMIEITKVGDYAFYDKGIESVTIPDKIVEIGEGAFAYNDLTSVTIPGSVKIIGEHSFMSSNLKSVKILSGVETIGETSFYGNEITDLELGNGIVEIETGAFARNLLTEVTIPNSVTTIGEVAFISNNLTDVTIGTTEFMSSIESIGGSAFSNQTYTDGNGITHKNNLDKVKIYTTTNSNLINNNQFLGFDTSKIKWSEPSE